jgi:hypothetical protein
LASPIRSFTASWDYSIELEDLAGNRVTGTEFKGEVLILNFWATWDDNSVVTFVRGLAATPQA